MGRNGLFMSEAVHFYAASATSRCNTIWVGMPHEMAHCPMAVIRKAGMAGSNVIKRGAFRNKMPLIAYMHAWAQRDYRGGYIHSSMGAGCGQLCALNIWISPKLCTLCFISHSACVCDRRQQQLWVSAWTESRGGAMLQFLIRSVSCGCVKVSMLAAS